MHQEAILKAPMVKTLPPLTYHMPTKNASTCRIGVQAFIVSHHNKAPDTKGSSFSLSHYQALPTQLIQKKGREREGKEGKGKGRKGKKRKGKGRKGKGRKGNERKGQERKGKERGCVS